MNDTGDDLIEDIFTLSNGPLVIRIPKVLTKEDAQDAADFLVLIVERMKRQVKQ